MKKILLTASILFFIACSGVKKTQKALNSGNYESAIYKALDNLIENKFLNFDLLSISMRFFLLSK